jgi:hypothetical protein
MTALELDLVNGRLVTSTDLDLMTAIPRRIRGQTWWR